MWIVKGKDEPKFPTTERPCKDFGPRLPLRLRTPGGFPDWDWDPLGARQQLPNKLTGKSREEIIGEARRIIQEGQAQGMDTSPHSFLVPWGIISCFLFLVIANRAQLKIMIDG